MCVGHPHCDGGPMRVLLIGNYAGDQQESMLRFARLLAGGLEASGHEVRLVQPPIVCGRLVTGMSRLSKWLGYIDKLLLFPRQLRRFSEWADVVHICDHSNSVYCSNISGRPVVVTCHDMLAVRSALGEFPEKPTRWSGRIYQRLILRGLKRAAIFACVSDATRQDVIRLVGEKGKMLRVVHNGLNYPYRPMDKTTANSHLKKLGLDPNEDFLLHVGGNQWYKNRMGVLQIYRHLLNRPEGMRPRLVLVGKPWTREMTSFVREHHLGELVLELTDASNQELQALYSTAKGFLFPSFYEGFGWPVIEAQACGCPVFTSNRPPMTEIGGSSAVYIDPEAPVRAAERIAIALAKGEGGGEWAILHAEKFTDKRMIDEYIKLYGDTLHTAGIAQPYSASNN